ncbi:hypothetical protein QMK17_00320 [Rhodococcus sp. G-MC3]|nr:hypothetical protein [Rhodococcus sp. G-MC3]MDJ0391773.1 hypothetical protein [Rhodococcus sp. G-MC3]
MVGALTLIGAPAAAAPEIQQAQFETYCTPQDSGLEELSGLTSIDGVLYAIGDSGTDHRLAVLGENCSVARWIDVPVDPYDVEDLSSYGSQLWLADTGDNLARRDTVALTRMDPAGGEGELHRFTYPDGPHDAETLLIEPGGRPVIVTKEVSGASGIYVPSEDESVDQLPSPGPTPLKKVGEFAFERTPTVGGPAFITGSILATGGAVSRDGSVAALRTYNDIYLFPVPGGNVAKALTAEPTVIALPPQPQGEAITFDDDGNLLVASEAADGPLPPIQLLPGAQSLVPTTPAAVPPESPSGGRWLLGAIAAAGVLALVSIVYVFGLARRRG